MKLQWKIRLRQLVRAPLMSPAWFLGRALLIALFFLVCHALGLREHTTFLSGTTASVDASIRTSGVLGIVYIVAYFGFLLVTPIFLIAALLLKGWQQAARKGSNGREGNELCCTIRITGT